MNLTARLPRKAPHHVIQATANEGLAQGPYVVASLTFEPATFRTEGAELTTEPPHPRPALFSLSPLSLWGFSATIIRHIHQLLEMAVIAVVFALLVQVRPMAHMQLQLEKQSRRKSPIADIVSDIYDLLVA